MFGNIKTTSWITKSTTLLFLVATFIVCAPQEASAQVPTNGPDNLQGGPLPDIIYDSPNANPAAPTSDGAKDNINVQGGGIDLVIMGPEDAMMGDPDDEVVIVTGNGTLVFIGTFSEYLTFLKIMDRIKKRLPQLLEMGLSLLESLGSALGEIVGVLTSLSGEGDYLCFSDLFPDWTDKVAEPSELDNWFPFAEGFEPDSDEICLSNEEWASYLLSAAIATLEYSQTPPDASDATE